MALWILVEDVQTEKPTHGYSLTYVDEFLVIGPSDVRSAIEEEISRHWKIKVTGSFNQFDIQNPDASLKFLSTRIRSLPTSGGFIMDQEAFVDELLKTWEMSECRPLLIPGEEGSGV